MHFFLNICSNENIIISIKCNYYCVTLLSFYSNVHFYNNSEIFFMLIFDVCFAAGIFKMYSLISSKLKHPTFPHLLLIIYKQLFAHLSRSSSSPPPPLRLLDLSAPGLSYSSNSSSGKTRQDAINRLKPMTRYVISTYHTRHCGTSSFTLQQELRFYH